jgi:hypothetical protein
LVKAKRSKHGTEKFNKSNLFSGCGKKGNYTLSICANAPTNIRRFGMLTRDDAIVLEGFARCINKPNYLSRTGSTNIEAGGVGHDAEKVKGGMFDSLGGEPCMKTKQFIEVEDVSDDDDDWEFATLEENKQVLEKCGFECGREIKYQDEVIW